ncbi:MAG: T9SS type A sorting domain-containing protein, partial [Bacteroidota bacterium]
LSLLPDTFACGFNVSCHNAADGSITALASGGCNDCPSFGYLWSDGQTGQTAYNLVPGTYSVTVSDANGSTVTDSLTLSGPTQLQASLNSPTFSCGTNVSCFGAQDGQIDLNVIGGADCENYTYQWTGPNGYTSTIEDPMNIGAGTYCVIVTDANGCLLSASITLTEPAPLTITALSSPLLVGGFNVSCAGENDGSIQLTVEGGVDCGSYSYLWNGPGGPFTTANLGNVSAGTYTILVTDSNGCTVSDTIVLTEPNPIFISGVVTDAACAGENSGSIDLMIDGGVVCSDYLVAWSGPNGYASVEEDIDSLAAGVYVVTVADDNGCFVTDTFVVMDPAIVTDEFGCCQDTFKCCGDTVALEVTFAGQGPWTLVYDDGVSNQTITTSNNPYVIFADEDETRTYTLVSVAAGNCEGIVCGSATVAVNACGNGNDSSDSGSYSGSGSFSGSGSDDGSDSDSDSRSRSESRSDECRDRRGGHGSHISYSYSSSQSRSYSRSNSGSSSGSDDCGDSECADLCYNAELLYQFDLGNGCYDVGMRITCDANCSVFSASSDDGGWRQGHDAESNSAFEKSGESAFYFDRVPQSTEPEGTDRWRNRRFFDISIPCGTISNISTSWNNASASLVQDGSHTGMSGIRVDRLPRCNSRRPAKRSIDVFFRVCLDTAQCHEFCAPLVGFYESPCVQYEMATASSNTATRTIEMPETDDASVQLNVFPNPFSTTTTVNFSVTEKQTVIVEVLNASHQVVANLFSGTLAASQTESVPFSPSRLVAGMYYVQIRTAQGVTLNRKLIYVRY